MFEWFRNKNNNEKTYQVCTELSDHNECNLVAYLKDSVEREKKLQEEINKIRSCEIPDNLIRQKMSFFKIIDSFKYIIEYRSPSFDYLLNAMVRDGKLDDISATISIFSYLKTMVAKREEVEEKLNEEKRIQKELKEKLGIV